MSLLRWVFHDPTDDTTWTVPLNPTEMSTPFATKQRQTQGGPEGILTLQAPVDPFEWTFGGKIRTQAHHETLLTWSQKNYPVRITDHFARTWEVILTQYSPEDQRPTPQNAWRMAYTMRTLMLRRVS